MDLFVCDIEFEATSRGPLLATLGKIFHAQTYSRIPHDHEVASIVASCPHATDGLERDISAKLEITLNFR
jgi:hypothetical protein